AAGEGGSAAAACAAGRAAGLSSIDSWLRLRQARVTRDTAAAFRLLADLPAPVAREAGAARAQALLAAGDSAAALEALAQAGRSLDVARLARALGDSSRARDALYALMARAPESDDAAAAVGAPAIYRRALILARLGDAGAPQALSGFAQSFPADTAAPTALYVLGDMLADRGDWGGAARWFDELIARYPADLRASLARYRLAAQALRDSLRDSASALFRAEVAAGAPQRMSARFWLGKLALLSGDTAGARAAWLTLAREDSIGYYGLRARREGDLPP